ncbi:MAG: RHS repeat protein [Acidobacteria bacterium]|nr:RHS repeat protein [Acidobacteriota bacterium]
MTVSISEDTEGQQWTVTEGSGGSTGPATVTGIERSDTGSGWQIVRTVGTGQDAVATTTDVDLDGRVVQVAAPGGVTTVTSYRGGERRLSFAPGTVTRSGGSLTESTSYGYAAGSSLPVSIARTGPGGVLLTTAIERDAAGNPTSITSPDGRTTTQSFDELGRVAERTVSTGAATSLVYDDTVRGTGETVAVTTVSGAGAGTTSIVRDAYGHARKTTVVVPGQPVRVTTTDVNRLGWTLSATTGGASTRTAYDVGGRIESIASGSASQGGFTPRTVTTPSYTSAGMIASIVRSEGGLSETTTMTYDAAGRLASSRSAGVTTSYAYDSAGRVTTRSEGCGGSSLTTAYAYDEAGRLAFTTSPGGKTTTFAYDALGRQTGRTGPDGLTEQLTLDADGSVLERKLVDGQSRVWSWEEYAYDAVGRRTGRTVHRFPVTPEPDTSAEELLDAQTAFYDSGPEQGLVHTMTDALGRETSFTYDDAGREVERDLPDGTVVTTVYTADGKVEARTVTGPSGWSETTSYTYDDHGRVATVTDPSGRMTSYFYDELGRKSAEMVDGSDIDPQTGDESPVTRFTTWSYGELGRTVREIRPDGATITRDYDERGELTSYTDSEGNATVYGYDCEGRLASITYPDGSTKAFTYTPDGELETITRADGTVVSFAYDDAGRMESATVNGQPDASYSYDAAGRLLTASNGAASLTFTWDSVGNQLSEPSRPGLLGFGRKAADAILRCRQPSHRPRDAGRLAGPRPSLRRRRPPDRAEPRRGGRVAGDVRRRPAGRHRAWQRAGDEPCLHGRWSARADRDGRAGGGRRHRRSHPHAGSDLDGGSASQDQAAPGHRGAAVRLPLRRGGSPGEHERCALPRRPPRPPRPRRRPSRLAAANGHDRGLGGESGGRADRPQPHRARPQRARRLRPQRPAPGDGPHVDRPGELYLGRERQPGNPDGRPLRRRRLHPRLA